MSGVNRTIRCASVDVAESRWDLRLTFRDASGGIVEELIASADAWFTSHDGIWVGTPAEHVEEASS